MPTATVNAVSFEEFAFDSPAYHRALALREQVLRLPLGRRLEHTDTAEDSRQWHFGCFAGSELLACVIAKPLGGERAKLRQMAVGDNFRGQGVGAHLLTATEQVLSRRTIVELELAARRCAVGFYEALGYRAQGAYFKELAIDHITMVKSLTSA